MHARCRAEHLSVVAQKASGLPPAWHIFYSLAQQLTCLQPIALLNALLCTPHRGWKASLQICSVQRGALLLICQGTTPFLGQDLQLCHACPNAQLSIWMRHRAASGSKIQPPSFLCLFPRIVRVQPQSWFRNQDCSVPHIHPQLCIGMKYGAGPESRTIPRTGLGELQSGMWQSLV